MAIFTDEIYETLDPISQMVEPFKCPILDVLSAMPDELIVSDNKAKDFLFDIANEFRYLKINSAMVYLFPRMMRPVSSSKYEYAYGPMLAERINVSMTGDFRYNETTGFISETPDIKFLKLKDDSESKLISDIVDRASLCINIPSGSSKDVVSRIREMAELLEIKIEPESKNKRGAKFWTQTITNQNQKINAAQNSGLKR